MTTEPFADGIYFDMPEEAYHAIPRLSTSGIQNLLVSAGTFWAGSWLNPKKAALLRGTALAMMTLSPQIAGDIEPVVEALEAIHPNLPELPREKVKKETEARTIGKLYHTARLEPDVLDKRFCRQIDPADFPEGMPVTGKDMEALLVAASLPKSGSVMEQAERLRAGGYSGPIWHLELAEWKKALEGRIPIDAEKWEDAHVDMERIHALPEIAARLSGGQAEVVILWTCPRTNIPMKARVDYLQAAEWADLKTYANPNGKKVEQAIADAFQYNRYHIQAANYDEAIEAVRVGAVHIMGDATEAQRDLIKAIQLRDERLECWFIFVEKGGIPNIWGRQVRFYDIPINTQAQHAGASAEGIARQEKMTRTPQLWHSRARREIFKAKRIYHAYSLAYEPGQAWLPFNPLGEFSDMDFRAGWLDEEVGQ